MQEGEDFYIVGADSVRKKLGSIKPFFIGMTYCYYSSTPITDVSGASMSARIIDVEKNNIMRADSNYVDDDMRVTSTGSGASSKYTVYATKSQNYLVTSDGTTMSIVSASPGQILAEITRGINLGSFYLVIHL